MIEAEERTHRLAGAIYGTILVASVLAASSVEGNPTPGAVAAYVAATVIVFWLAHAWANTLASAAIAAPGTRRALADALKSDWPLVQSAGPPLAVLGLASLLGATDENAIDIAIWSCVGVLTAWGGFIAHREGASPVRVVVTAAGCGGLGALLVLLKALVH